MKLLVYRWDIYPYDDIITTFTEQGHHVDVLAFPIANHLSDVAFEKAFRQQLENDYSLVFSVNYYAVIAKICTEYQIPYAAWTCDSPLLSLQDDSVLSPYSHIFLLDYQEYKTLLRRGAPHVHYLPLAGLRAGKSFSSAPAEYSYEVSFVGNLYDKNRYEEMCYYLPGYLCGYMDAAIEAQKQVSGGNLLPQLLSDDILMDLSEYTKVAGGNSTLEELRMHFATAVLSYKVAADMRVDALNLLAARYDTHLFTTSQGERLEQVAMHPAVDYHTEMPHVFHHSKINLNLTIPNIENGIPLRAFDILASGGFLLTDYREVLCRHFEDGTDLVIFYSLPDMLAKVEYYLTHPEERRQIAGNGQKKVQQLHSYETRLTKLLQTVFPD